MTVIRHSCRSATRVLAVLLLILTAGTTDHTSAKQKEYIAYDFSRPREVFKTTLAESVADSTIDPAILHKILSVGQIVIVNDTPDNPDIPWVTTAGILVNAPARQVFETICDYNHYPEFMPQVNAVSSVRINDSIDRIDYNLGIKVLFLIIDVPYSVYHYYSPPYRVDWVMAGGEFNENLGAYEVIPVPPQSSGQISDKSPEQADGQPEEPSQQSMVFYTSFAEPRNAIVNRLSKDIPLLDMLINLSAGTLVVKAIRERAEQQHIPRDLPETPPEEIPLRLSDLVRQHPETLAALSSRGKIVIMENTDPAYYTGGVIINRPITETYDAVRDMEGSAAQSDLYAMKVLEQSPQTMRVKIKTIIKLVFRFSTTYIANFSLTPPQYQSGPNGEPGSRKTAKISWEQEPSRQISGVAGSWEFIELDENRTLVMYRYTADLHSQGFLMRRLLSMEPAFEPAIQASMVQFLLHDNKVWAESYGRSIDQPPAHIPGHTP